MEATMQTKAPTPLLTDQLLAELAAPDSHASMGEWDVEARALLAVAVPEMAAELLLRRQALSIVIHPDAARKSVERARAIIRAPDPIEPRQLMIAAQTLLRHSRCASERAVAKQLVAEMEAAA
jgi:hypothetical protein